MDCIVDGLVKFFMPQAFDYSCTDSLLSGARAINRRGEKCKNFLLKLLARSFEAPVPTNKQGTILGGLVFLIIIDHQK